MQQSLSCPQCGAPVVANQQFCGICGTKLSGHTQPQPSAPVCAQCGNPLAPGQQFCAACGAKQSPDSQTIPIQQTVKPVSQPRSQVVRTVSVAPPQIQQAPAPQPATTKIKNTAAPKPPSQKYGLLRLGATTFQVLGWIILTGGIAASLGLAIFILIGGQLMPTEGGSALAGGTAIIIAATGLCVSIVYGILLLALGQLCNAVAEIAQKI